VSIAKVRQNTVFNLMAHWVRNRSIWQARLLGFGLGILYIGGHAPFFFWPLSLLAITGFVWLLDGASKTSRPVRNGALVSWYFGLGQFLAGMYWIAFAFIERGPEFIWLIPFALFFLAGGLALFWLLAGAVAMKLWSRSASRILVFVCCFFAAEWLRGHVFTGLPWNHPGLIWIAGGSISQIVSLVGAWGLALFTLFMLAAPAALTWSGDGLVARTIPSIIALTLFSVLFVTGLVRLETTEITYVEGVKLRVIQAQIDQSDHYLDLSSKDGLENITHIIWPEGALPLLLLESPDVLEQMGRRFFDGPILISGITRREVTEDQKILFRNSLVALSFSRGIPVLEMVYDKYHLTPFGEYLPFGKLFASSGIKALTPLGGGFTAGPGPVTTMIPGAPAVSPQICYESIFAGLTPGGKDRPKWIVNVTNDSWFGPTTGPKQHIQQVKYRAIEEGLPIARSASSGISGVIDPLGRLITKTSANTNASIDSKLPEAFEATLFSKFNNISLVLWFLLVLAVAGLQIRRSR
jgi:apolipoprotein N-acyltransferase